MSAQPKVKRIRSLNANARFHATLSDWSKQSGQSVIMLKRRVKDHVGAFTDVEIPNDERTDRLLGLFAQVLLALGKPDLMLVMPNRSVRLYHTSAKFTVEMMAKAIETIHMMAGEEGLTVGLLENWDHSA